tara:strand:+ start:86 stop:454 length:369 start_codon:yes stop_codon:yes gene_type:complete
MIFPILQSDQTDEGGEVICPSCGESYTHHLAVKSVTRYCEDDKKGTSVTVRGHNVSFSNDAETDNASARRDSFSIKFTCESGCDDFILAFSQHKGITFLHTSIIKGAGCSWFDNGGDDDNAP